MDENKSFIKRMLLIPASIVLGFVLILTCILLAYSPGKIEQYPDDSGKQITGSIAEKTFIKIGGVKQGMFIRSRNINNPVLLYVHGGPAFPNYFLIDKFNPGLEDYFTVCYWEQRGGGLSYTSKVTLESMNFNQFMGKAFLFYSNKTESSAAYHYELQTKKLRQSFLKDLLF